MGFVGNPASWEEKSRKLSGNVAEVAYHSSKRKQLSAKYHWLVPLEYSINREIRANHPNFQLTTLPQTKMASMNLESPRRVANIKVI